MRILLFITVLLLAACSQISKKKDIDESQISEAARKQINQARDYIKASNYKSAIQSLAIMSDESLSPIEKALKYNLKGVALFNSDELQSALLNFEVSEKYSPKDTLLYSQVQLNMASVHFRLNQFSELKNRLSKIDVNSLNDVEKKKFYQLELAYGKKFENPKMITRSTIALLADAKSISNVTGSPHYESLKKNYELLNISDRLKTLESFKKSKNLAVAHLAQLEAESRYNSGDKSGAIDYVSWLKSEYSDVSEIEKYINDFELRIENSKRINLNQIGLILPLSGERSVYGQKVLNGVDSGLKLMSLNDNVNVSVKDGMNSPALGAQAVVELVREQRVAMIIGGLYSESAEAEYLEARKYGVLYVSLSQINLPKEEKNHLLIEIQGSIESQVEALLSPEMIKKFGNKVGIIYPNNEGGKSYADEIWRKALERDVKVTSLASFAKGTHDFRDTVQNFLGLSYPREREEELKILDDVYSNERSSIRRVQTLPPILDFDWVFLATYPVEAISMIPTLGYFDANRIKLIGGPSWVSNSLVKEQKNLGTLYFIGEDPKALNQEILNQYNSINEKPATIVEIFGLEAIKVGAEVLQATKDVSNREDFDSQLKAKSIRGLSTEWKFKDGVWLKDMSSLVITRGEIKKLF